MFWNIYNQDVKSNIKKDSRGIELPSVFFVGIYRDKGKENENERSKNDIVSQYEKTSS